MSRTKYQVEIIYAVNTTDHKYMYYSKDPESWSGDTTKYIRADVVEQREAALQCQLDEQKAMVNELRGLFRLVAMWCEVLPLDEQPEDTLDRLLREPDQPLADVEARVWGSAINALSETISNGRECSPAENQVFEDGFNDALNYVEKCIPLKYQSPTNENQIGSKTGEK